MVNKIIYVVKSSLQCFSASFCPFFGIFLKIIIIIYVVKSILQCNIMNHVQSIKQWFLSWHGHEGLADALLGRCVVDSEPDVEGLAQGSPRDASRRSHYYLLRSLKAFGTVATH
jgi:hypothetical protein